MPRRRRRSRVLDPWMRLGGDAIRLSIAAQQVVMLRLWRLATTGANTRNEWQRMVSEKAAGFAEAAGAAGLASALGRSPPASLRAGLKRLRRRVAANKSRLSR